MAKKKPKKPDRTIKAVKKTRPDPSKDRATTTSRKAQGGPSIGMTGPY